MSKPLITLVNAETGETETREMNDLELSDYKAIQTELAEEAQAQAKAEADKAALLAKLGITADEAKLLLS